MIDISPKRGGTTMVQEGYGTSIQALEDLTDRDSLSDAVTKYMERATQPEEHMTQMEANFEETIAMMSMQQPPQPAYYQQPPPHTHTTYLTQQQQHLTHNPPAKINIPAPQPHQQHQAYQTI